jgi:hypothetical protein
LARPSYQAAVKTLTVICAGVCLLACGRTTYGFETLGPGGATSSASTSATAGASSVGATTSGSTSSAGTSSSSSSSSSTSSTSGAASSLWPLVPNHGRGVIAAPNLIFLTYAGDPNQAIVQQYGVWIADGGYLPLVAGEYGIGNATAQFVTLTDSPPTSASFADNPFPAYLDSHFATDPNLPPDAPGNIYVLVMPASWADTSIFCSSLSGFHDHYTSATGHVPLYAVIGDCAGTTQSIEVTISHEVVEASTDPLTTSWVFTNGDQPWFYLTGELADMCESNSTVYTQGQFSGQLIWSNAAAADGGVPCQPWPAGQTYLSIVAPLTMATAPLGGSANLTLTGWASGPFSGSFQLFFDPLLAVPNDGGYIYNFDLNPSITNQDLMPGGSATLTLSVPSTAAVGQSGAVWVIAQDTATGLYYGSAVVGVTAQ